MESCVRECCLQCCLAACIGDVRNPGICTLCLRDCCKGCAECLRDCCQCCCSDKTLRCKFCRCDDNCCVCCFEDEWGGALERAPLVSAPQQRSMDEAGGRAAPAPEMEGATRSRYEAPPARGADDEAFAEPASVGAPPTFRSAAGDAGT